MLSHLVVIHQEAEKRINYLNHGGVGKNALIYKISDTVILKKSKLFNSDIDNIYATYKREIAFFELIDTLGEEQKYFTRLLKYNITDEQIKIDKLENEALKRSRLVLNQYITYAGDKLLENRTPNHIIRTEYKKFISEVYLALNIMDKNGWYHGDIHLNNIMRGPGNYIIIDYESVNKKTDDIMIDSKKFLLHCVLLIAGHINVPRKIGELETCPFIAQAMSKHYGSEYTNAVNYLSKKYEYDDRNIVIRAITYRGYVGNKQRKKMAIQLDFMIYVVCRYTDIIALIIENGIHTDKLSPIKKEPISRSDSWRRPIEPSASNEPKNFKFPDPLINPEFVLQINECTTYAEILLKIVNLR